MGGCLIALAAAAALTGCSSGSSTPAAPTTGHQALARLLTNADLPDGIKTDDYPNSSSLSGGPPFAQESCTNLIDPAGALAYNGPKVPIYAVQELIKSSPPHAADPEAQSWGGAEYVIVYRADGAQQAMTGVSQLVRTCARSAETISNNGISVTLRVHLSTIPGIGDQTLDVQVRTSNGAFSLASDWTVTRSGHALLVVSEDNTVETQYLLPVMQAAWKAYSQ
jgi:hypothetical protein